MARRRSHRSTASVRRGCLLQGLRSGVKRSSARGLRRPRARTDKVHALDADFSPSFLCRNETGYRYSALVSMGFVVGSSSRPRIDWQLLKENAEGLVCLSAASRLHPAAHRQRRVCAAKAEGAGAARDLRGGFYLGEDHGIWRSGGR
jgi:hypothetical protein